MNFKIIEEISPEIYSEISTFENSTLYHTSEWHEFIKKTFGWKTAAIIGHNEEGHIFFLPFISKRRLSLNKINISLPFSHLVNLTYRQNTSINIESLSAFIKTHLANIEIHADLETSGFMKNRANYITKLDLRQFNTVDTLFSSFDYKSIRYMINKAQKNNLRIENSPTKEVLSDMYRLELMTRHRQGSPIYPKSFFENIFKYISNKNLSISLIYNEDIPISGSIYFHNLNHTVYAYSASVNDKNLKNLGGNELGLWLGIKEAFRRNHEWFDFGTTPISQIGLLKYKEKWGGISELLNYSYYPEIHTINRDSKSANLVSDILKKMPLPLFKVVSSTLIKRLI
jgi:lipid II:glycine glycyltransferase (peptidoglycan interpeptide bridge formation enzyme)